MLFAMPGALDGLMGYAAFADGAGIYFYRLFFRIECTLAIPLDAGIAMLGSDFFEFLRHTCLLTR